MVFISCINLSLDGGTTPLLGELREVDDAEFVEEVDSFDGWAVIFALTLCFNPFLFNNAITLYGLFLSCIYYCASLTKYRRDIQTIGRGCRNISTSLKTIPGAEPIFWMPNFIKNSTRTFEEQYTSLIFLHFCDPVTCMFAPPMRGVK